MRWKPELQFYYASTFFFFLLLILALEANLITWKLQPAIKNKIKFVEPTVREEGFKKNHISDFNCAFFKAQIVMM